MLFFECQNVKLNHVIITDPDDVPNGIYIKKSIVSADDLLIYNFKESLIDCRSYTNLTLTNSNLHHCQNDAIYLADQVTIEITNCQISDCDQSGLYVKDSQCIIKNNTFKNLLHCPIRLIKVDNFDIEKNHFTDIKNTSIWITKNSKGKIIENEFTNIEGNGINIAQNCEILVEKNSIKNTRYPSIFIGHKSTVKLNKNKIINSDSIGLMVRDAELVVLGECEIVNSKESAVSVIETRSCCIQNSTISNSSFSSIKSINDSKVTVKNCNISNSDKYAFFSVCKSFIFAENNKIDHVGEFMVKLAFDGGGDFIDNEVLNCPSLFCCQNPNAFLFSGNGNFQNLTNQKAKSSDLIEFYEEKFNHDDQMCLICHKNKSEVCLYKCGHRVLCMNCSEKVKLLEDRCPLCNVIVEKVSAGIFSSNDDNKCIICFENDADSLVMPCGHICACSSCLENWFSNNDTCPICRNEQSSYMKLFYGLKYK